MMLLQVKVRGMKKVDVYAPKNATPQAAFDAVKLLIPEWEEIKIIVDREQEVPR